MEWGSPGPPRWRAGTRALVREYPLRAARGHRHGPGTEDAGAPNPERQEADAFARLALETLRAAGIQGELHYDPERFLIQVPCADGQELLTLFLTNLHAEYRAAPPVR